MGDSHAALFAHAGWRPGHVKATYGTGSSVMSVADPSERRRGPLPDHRVADRRPRLRPRGQHPRHRRHPAWLAELLGSTPDELAALAAPSSDGVHLVPAFGGLGAPWWDDAAVGLLSGLTFGTRLPQIARAALESIAFQVEDVVAALDRATGATSDAARRRRADRQPDAHAAAGRHQRAPRRARPRARPLGARRRPPGRPHRGRLERRRARSRSTARASATSPPRTPPRASAGRAAGTTRSSVPAARPQPHFRLTPRRWPITLFATAFSCEYLCSGGGEP